MGNCPQTAVIINWFGLGRLQELQVQAEPQEQQQQHLNHGVGTARIRIRAISLWLD